jgi:hypothetical protein
MSLCAGLSNEEETGIGSRGADRSYLRNRRAGAPTREALVSPFNGVLANQAACDVLQMILCYPPSAAVAVYRFTTVFPTR